MHVQFWDKRDCIPVIPLREIILGATNKEVVILKQIILLALNSLQYSFFFFSKENYWIKF